MSIETTVIIEESKLPSPKELQQFISQSQLDLKIDTDFKWGEHEGWLPCEYSKQETGFELYAESYTPSNLVAEGFVTEEESVMLGNRSYLVTFVTHTSVLDALSAFLVSGCLAKLADGYILENSEPPFISADTFYKDIKSSEKEFLRLKNE